MSGPKAAEPYFVLADSGRSDKLCAPGVIATFGEPRELVKIGHYELLIYDAENEALDRFRKVAAEREKAFDLEPR